MSQSRGAPPLALASGLLLLAAWLVGWRILSDAAGVFATSTMSFGLLCLLATYHPLTLGRPPLRRALGIAGRGAIGLAVAAALSLGAFLPTRVAEWVSPVLGRFGGSSALLLLAVAVIYMGVIRRYRHPADRSLDLATLLVVLALWLRTQTARQIAFPPPPTLPAILDSRLALLDWLTLGLAAAALLLRWNERVPATAKRPWALVARAYGRWLWRWGAVATVLGVALAATLGPGNWWRYLPAIFLLLLGTPLGGLRQLNVAAHLRNNARHLGWLALMLLALILAYAATSEDLEAVFARNTLERRALLLWERALGEQHTVSSTTAGLSGTVRDDGGRPIVGASVVVADLLGRSYTATSGADGRYRIANVPTGNYLPLAISPTHLGGGRVGPTGRVATVRAGDAAGIDFQLRPRPAYDTSANGSLQLGEQTEITVESLQTDTVLRRPFTFANRGLTLDGGIVHEPLPAAGPGPFPILLIIYPGEAASWEGVSVPLAARGHVVVSYFPRRLLDLDGDLDDLRLLLNLAVGGQLSPRGDGSRVVLVGGSVSTVYTYLLAQTFAGQPFAANVPALIQYGGLFDFFTFRRSWEAGEITIDPGISELEYLLIALGRPDTRPELYLRLSPRHGLDPTTLPPTLLVHANKDIIVPVEQSQLAADAMNAVGIEHTLLLYPELEHYLDIGKRDPAQLDMLERTIAFLRTWTDPRRVRP